MKIVFVLECANRLNNGTTATCLRFADELRKRGHDVVLIGEGYDGADASFYIGLEHFKFPVFEKLIAREGFNFVKIDLVKIYNAIKDADLIHLFLPFKLSKIAQLIADPLGIPVSSAFHMQPQNVTSAINLGNAKFVNNALYSSFKRYLYNYTKNVHCPSEMIANQLREHGYDRNKFWVISNGVNSYFHPVPSEKPAELKDKYIVLMSGRLAGEKRQDLIIKAVAASKYNEKIQVILCGQGPAKAHYEKLSVKMGLKNPLIIKFCNAEELRQALNFCDLYVHASDFEIEGISCIEAFACGAVPVISDSKLSATNTFALDKQCIFKHGNVSSLKHRINYFYENPEERDRLSKEYVEYAKSFALSNQVDKMEEFVQAAVEDKKKGEDIPTLYPRKKDIRRSRKIFKKLLKAGAIHEMPMSLKK